MVATERRISTAQIFAVIFILGMSLKMMMLPVLLLKSCGRDSILCLTAILISELICLGVLIAALVLSPEKSFAELLRGCIGKWASKVVFALFAIYFFLKLALLAGEVRIFFCENLFYDFHWNIYAIPFFGLCIVMAMGSLRSLGRTSQFMFPFIAAATLLMFVLIGRGVDFTEILPVGEYAAKDVVNSSLRYAMWYGDFSAIVVMLGSVKRSRHTAALCAVSGVISAAVVMFFMLGLVASFSNVCFLIRFGQSVTGMSQYALGNIMHGRFDLLLFCIWMFAVFIKAGIFSYAAAYCIRSIVPCNRALPALIIAALQYVFIFLFPSATGLHSFMSDYCAVPALVFQFLIPAFALTAALVGRKKEAKEGAKNDEGEAEESKTGLDSENVKDNKEKAESGASVGGEAKSEAE